MLDNKCPEALIAFMHKEGVTFQLVLPHLHRTNTVERAIQTFNCNFLQLLAAAIKTFPSVFGIVSFRKLCLR